jgi:hypothetical protein
MAKWVWGGTTADFNPEHDTGWLTEPVFAEQHPVGSSSSVIQEGGLKSARRTVSGITKSAAFKSALDVLHTARTVFTLVDHRGASSSCKTAAPIKWTEIKDATNLGYTFRYEIELIKR